MSKTDFLNRVFNEDMLEGVTRLPDEAIDLIVADPPYGLGKDYGNGSDKLSAEKHLEWYEQWISLCIPKLKSTGSFYIFATWQYSPEIFSFMKKKLIMVNEVIWDRKVPSMGGTIRKFSSVHDNIGFFAKSKKYFFDLDPIRIPYDEKTKKARTRSIFVGHKWLEIGYNPKDVWSVSRLHREHREREDHPTQKPLELIERMVLSSCPKGGTVLDPFMGTGTTAVACIKTGRNYVGFEINEKYCKTIEARIKRARGQVGLFEETAPIQKQQFPDLKFYKNGQVPSGAFHMSQIRTLPKNQLTSPT